MKSVPTKLTGDTYTADEVTKGVSQEAQNVVIDSGQSLNESDLFQSSKAMSINAAGADFYIDSGASNSLILTPVGSKKAPPVYFNGQRISGFVGNNITGASTVNVNVVGVVPLVFKGAALKNGFMNSGDYFEARFDSANARFDIITSGQSDGKNVFFKQTQADMSAINISSVSEGTIVYMVSKVSPGDGAEGEFRVTKTNISAEVTADPQQGVHVAFDSDPSGASGGFIRNDISHPNVLWYGVLGGATNDTVAFQACIDSSFKTFIVRFNSAGYTVNTITNTDTTFIFLGKSTFNGTADEKDLKAVIFEDGNYQGVPIADGLRSGKLEIVAGVMRQQAPAAVTITAVGTLATATKTAHGYSNGDNIRHDGAAETDYNGFFAISNVTANTYDYTMAGSPSSPATGSPTARKNAQWDFITGAHVQTGVAGTGAVATGSSILITFEKTYTNIISWICNPDETLANRNQLVIGASVGLSDATIKGSISIVGAHYIRWDGAAWVIVQNTYATINARVASFSSGDLRIEHEFCPGADIMINEWTHDGLNTPFYPLIRNIPSTAFNTGVTINFMDPPAGTLRNDGAPNTSMSLQFTKQYSAGIVFDGTNVSSLGDSSTLDFSVGNIWFYGIFEV